MTSEIQNKINTNTIRFCKNIKQRVDKAVVTYSPSTGALTFNPKMVKLLNIEKWECVIAGYDTITKIIVLKRVEPEEYGSVTIHKPSATSPSPSPHTKERVENSRKVQIKYLINTSEIVPSKLYKAECNGVMIFLEPIEQN